MNVVYKIYCKNSEIKEIYIGSSKKFKARKYNIFYTTHQSVENLL